MTPPDIRWIQGFGNFEIVLSESRKMITSIL